MKNFLFPLVLLFSFSTNGYTMQHLPDYVIINDPDATNTAVLRTPAATITFPLSAEDREIIRILETKYDGEKNCVGLAAPQIGYGKKIIIFAVPNDPELKKWRPDLTDSMPKTLWINPSYTPTTQEKSTDYEACFSVKDLAGPVERYKTIKYKAQSIDGTVIEGIADGFLARAIQHETDHVNGTLFIDLVPEGKLLPIEEYRKMREAALKNKINNPE